MLRVFRTVRFPRQRLDYAGCRRFRYARWQAEALQVLCVFPDRSHFQARRAFVDSHRRTPGNTARPAPGLSAEFELFVMEA